MPASALNSPERATLGRLLGLTLVAGVLGALVGGAAGAVVLPLAAPSPEDRVWFVWLCAILTGAVTAIATIIASRVRGGKASGLPDVLAAVLLGGCAGALMALRMFGGAPRGKQLFFFALGALAGGCAIGLCRGLRRSPPKPADRRFAASENYSPAAAVCLVDRASFRTPIVDILLERKSRGRWFQFTLGSLLACTTIASIVLALWVRGPIKRRQVLTAIERGGGGRVRYASRAPEWVVDLLGDVVRGIFDEVDEIELRAATDADLARIAFLPHLRCLSLSGTVTDEAMKTVARWQSLEELRLGSAEITSLGLAQLRQLPRLRKLVVPMSIDDAGLEAVGAATGLETLSIGTGPANPFRPPSWGPLTAAGLSRLCALAGLKDLSLYGMPVGDDETAFLERLPRLQRLHLVGTGISDAGLEHLGRLEQLEWLDLGGVTGSQVTGSGFEGLSSLSQLRRLDLRGTSVTDQGLSAIAALKNLESLDLTGTKITDDGLVHLKPLKRLKHLDISFTAVSDVGLPGLEELADVDVFHHYGTSITSAGIARLEKIWQERRAAREKRTE